MRIKSRTSIASLLVLSCLPAYYDQAAPCRAADVALTLPDATVAYVHIPDVRRLQLAWEATDLGKMARDPELAGFLAGWTEATLDYQFPASRLQRGGDNLASEWRRALFGHYGEVTLALVSRPDQEPVALLCIDAGDEAPRVRGLLEAHLVRTVPRGQRRETRWSQGILKWTESDTSSPVSPAVFERDGLFVQSDDERLVRQLVEIRAGRCPATLAQNAAYRRWKSHAPTAATAEPQMEFFANLAALQNPREEIPRASAAKGELAPAALLVGGRLQVVDSPYDLRLDVELVADHFLEARISLMKPGRGDITAEEWVPREAATYATLHADPSGFRSANARTRDELKQTFRQLVAEGQEVDLPLPAGIECLAPFLTGRVSHARWFPELELGAQRDVYCAHLRRTAEFDQALKTWLNELGKDARPQTSGATTYHEISLTGDWSSRSPPICLACVDSLLLIANHPRALERALAARGQPAERWREQFEARVIASRFKRLGGEREPTGAVFVRPSEFVRQWHARLSDELQQALAIQLFVDEPFERTLWKTLQQHPLPPFNEWDRRLAPGGAVLTGDRDCWRLTCFLLRRS